MTRIKANIEHIQRGLRIYMIDYIFDKDHNEYAKIEYRHSEDKEYYCTGEILEYAIPGELSNLINEYTELVNGMCLSLLDDVEEKIYSYGLKLRDANVSIFRPEITNERVIDFFTKYPTARGFVDKYGD